VTIGWLWFLGMLVPVIGLVQVGAQARADRYTYLPLIGLAIAVAWGVPGLATRWLREGRARTAMLATAGAIAIGALGFATAVQLRSWRDTESVMRHALRVTESNAIAHAYLGVALLARGDAPSAASEWRESARIEPRDRVVANNLAWLLATSPDPNVRDGADAVVHAERASQLMRNDPSALDTLAAAYAAAGRFDEAVTTAERAASMARTAGALDLARQIHTRTEQYRRQRRWIER
jgi:predicted Zn-dependent protease